MAVDFKTFNAVAPLVAAVKKPILLRGRHGVGKSCVVYQTANDLGLPVVERRASQMTEGDLVGLPVISGETTTFNPELRTFSPSHRCAKRRIRFKDARNRPRPSCRDRRNRARDGVPHRL